MKIRGILTNMNETHITNISLSAKVGAKWNGLTMVLNFIISIAQISILTKYLSPSDFGIVALLLVFVSILTICVTIGFSDVLIVKNQATNVQLSTMYWLNVFVGIFIYTIVFLGSHFIENLISTSYDASFLLRVMSLSILIGSLCVQFRALMRRDFLFKQLALLDLCAHFFSFIIAVVLLYNGYGIWSLIIAILCQQTLTCLFLFTYAIKLRWLPKFIFNIKSVRGMIAFGSHRIVTTLLGNIYSRADQLTIGMLLGPASLGIYSVAYNFSMQPLLKINPVLTQVSFPVFSKLKNNNLDLVRGYRKGQRILSFINSPLLLGLLAVAPVFIPVFLGPGWEDAILILQILCIYGLLRSASNINIGLILAKEKYAWPTYWNLLLVFVIPASIYVAEEVSKSLVVVTYVVMFVQLFLLIISYFLFIRRLLGNFGYALIDDIGRPIIISSLMAFSVISLNNYINIESSFVELFILIAFGAAIYIFLSYLFQRKSLMELWQIIISRQ